MYSRKAYNSKKFTMWQRYVTINRSALAILLVLIIGADRALIAQQHAHPHASSQEELNIRYLEFKQGSINEAAFTNAVIAASANYGDSNDSLRALQEHYAEIKEIDNNTQLHNTIALLAEMTGQYDVAIESYRHIATQVSPGSREHSEALLSLAALLFNRGDFNKALAATKQILISTANADYTHRAYILQTRIEGHAVRIDPAIQKINQFIERYPESPHLRLAYIILIEFYQTIADADGAEHAQKMLAARFPDSVETGYFHGNTIEKMTNVPIPAILLRNSEQNILHSYDQTHVPPKQVVVASSSNNNNVTENHATAGVPVKIQIGSFSTPTYANSLQQKLRALGLQAVIDHVSQDGETRYKVRVLATEHSYASILDRLSQHNLSGFLVSE